MTKVFHLTQNCHLKDDSKPDQRANRQNASQKTEASQTCCTQERFYSPEAVGYFFSVTGSILRFPDLVILSPKSRWFTAGGSKGGATNDTRPREQQGAPAQGKLEISKFRPLGTDGRDKRGWNGVRQKRTQSGIRCSDSIATSKNAHNE